MSKQFVPISKDLWMSDSTTKKCFTCDRSFNAFRRKHHCRFCGLIFCSACCSRKVVLAYTRKPSRICNTCSEALAKAEVVRTVSICGPDCDTPDPFRSRTEEATEEPTMIADQTRKVSFPRDESEESSVSIIPNIYPDLEENTLDSFMKDFASDGHSDFEQACKEFLWRRTQQLSSDHGLDLKWSELVMRLAK